MRLSVHRESEILEKTFLFNAEIQRFLNRLKLDIPLDI